ncbi:unnamed protein product, partial [Ixodes persulcatus]
CGASQSSAAAPLPEGSVTRGRRTPRLPHVRGISGAEPFAARLRRPQDGETQGEGGWKGAAWRSTPHGGFAAAARVMRFLFGLQIRAHTHARPHKRRERPLLASGLMQIPDFVS